MNLISNLLAYTTERVVVSFAKMGQAVGETGLGWVGAKSSFWEGLNQICLFVVKCFEKMR